MTQIPKLFILLGRLGDILSCLPIMREESLAGARPTMMVANEYAPLFEGVSYCDCIPFEGDYNELDRAMEQAKALAEKVICLQVAGPPDAVKRHTYEAAGVEHSSTDSFVKEAWKFAGKFDCWKDQPPLVFDRRAPLRETAQFMGVLASKKRIILVHLDGTTSPFPCKNLCLELLHLKFPKAQIVDLAAFKADRFFDFLAIYSKAHCLVTCDSAHLHLAFACATLPVVALVNDRPSLWNGSPWRANHIAHIRYSDFPYRATEMLNAIELIGKNGSRFAINTKYVHLWSNYEINSENKYRAQDAWKAWDSTSMTVACPVEVGALGQDSQSILKDDKRYPTVKDVIRIGCMAANDDQIILLTRCDTFPSDNLFKQLSDGPLPAYAHRTIRNDGDTFHPAVDLFAFTRKWWDEHANEFPTMVMGADTLWYRVLLDLFLKYGARELAFAVWRPPGDPLSPPKEAPKRLIHNEKSASTFWKRNPSSIEPPKVTKQASGGWSINRHSLKPYGYNPSIIRFKGRLLMAYRWHPEHETQTRLAVAELAEDFSVKNDRELQVQARSAEDPRLFQWGDNLGICFLDSSWPETNPKCIVKYGTLREYQEHWAIEEIFQPLIGKNDGGHLEKNFVFFTLP